MSGIVLNPIITGLPKAELLQALINNGKGTTEPISFEDAEQLIAGSEFLVFEGPYGKIDLSRSGFDASKYIPKEGGKSAKDIIKEVREDFEQAQAAAKEEKDDTEPKYTSRIKLDRPLPTGQSATDMLFNKLSNILQTAFDARPEGITPVEMVRIMAQMVNRLSVSYQRGSQYYGAAIDLRRDLDFYIAKRGQPIGVAPNEDGFVDAERTAPDDFFKTEPDLVGIPQSYRSRLDDPLRLALNGPMQKMFDALIAIGHHLPDDDTRFRLYNFIQNKLGIISYDPSFQNKISIDMGSPRRRLGGRGEDGDICIG